MFKRMCSLDTPLFYYLMYFGSWEDMFEVGLDIDVLDGPMGLMESLCLLPKIFVESASKKGA